MTLLQLIFIILAIYRVAHLLTRETGPFRMGERWRNLHTGDDWIGEGLRCLWCVSFWLALPAGVWLGGPSEGWLAWLGIAGAVVALDKATERIP